LFVKWVGARKEERKAKEWAGMMGNKLVVVQKQVGVKKGEGIGEREQGVGGTKVGRTRVVNKL